MSTILFPHESARPIQKDMVQLIAKEVENKNNIVIHAPTGLGKCVGKDTLILTQDGLEKIEDIYLKQIKTNSLDKNLKIQVKQGQIIKKKKSQLYKLTTKTGREIEVTDDHKFFSIKNGKTEWIKLKDLKEEGYIASPSKLNILEDKIDIKLDQYLKLKNNYLDKTTIKTKPLISGELLKFKQQNNLTFKDISKSSGISQDKIKKIAKQQVIQIKDIRKIIHLINIHPKYFRVEEIGRMGINHRIIPHIDKKFAYFVGLIIGDGFIDSGKRKAINLSTKDKEILSTFKEIAKETKSNIRKKTGSDIDYYFENKPLISLLFSLGFPTSNKTSKVSIPNIFFKNKELLKEVIAGIYDTNGSIFDNTTIELCTKSENLKNSLLHALLALDIYPIIKEKYVKNKKYFRIYTCDTENNKKFHAQIKLRIKYKQERLNELIKKENNTNINIIPEINSLIKKCKEELQIPYSREKEYRIIESYLYNQRNPSKEGLKKTVRYFKKKTDKTSESFNKLKELANSNIFWDKIVKIKKTKKDFVYDASIPLTKNFIGNGIILHNTAASIAPVLSQALDKGKTIFFLTSKNTQHKIAIETLQAIRKRHNIELSGADIVGKKWMCLQPGVTTLPTGEFNEYCRTLREDKRCEFYENLKRGEQLTPNARLALAEMEQMGPSVVEETMKTGKEYKVCPYEIALLMAAKAHVIIADYYYLFHPRIRETFLKKNKKELENAIIIVDEAHNLPNRIKDLATANLSLVLLKRAASEAKKFGHLAIEHVMGQFAKLLRDLMKGSDDEKFVSQETFTLQAEKITSLIPLTEELYKIADNIREEQKLSSLGAVADFLDSWIGKDDGFTRIISKKRAYNQENITLSYRCLDPSIIAKEVVLKASSTILMSGTLTPTKMYSELLGFPPGTVEETYPSPFPEKNSLNLIIAKTSTKYTTRNEGQYQEIAKILTSVINEVPGNIAVFFPSYQMKDAIDTYLSKVEKAMLHEYQDMSKQEKEEVILSFRRQQLTGACLLAVVGGSFSEGIDLPGEELKGVVVVGLPLGRPDLETKALIEYYDKKFSKGWDYGYVFPAFNKIIQSAGRCIRSETDRGVIVFLDERFTWPQYYRCFPKTWKMKVSVNHYQEQIQKFFAKK
ncbi:hypothetical protein K9M74_00595 [Candidatus Woesearchaeota archaeon]|nr:hypothetical protein [Candidatus Woesearchaeota archaeon]